jgi:hypothetical protein
LDLECTEVFLHQQPGECCDGVAFFFVPNLFSSAMIGMFAAMFSGVKRSNPDRRSVLSILDFRFWISPPLFLAVLIDPNQQECSAFDQFEI